MRSRRPDHPSPRSLRAASLASSFASPSFEHLEPRSLFDNAFASVGLGFIGGWHNDSQAEKPPVARPGAQGYGEQLKAFYDRAHTELGMDVVAVNTVAKAKGVDLGKPTTDLRAFWVELTAEKEGKA